MTSNSIVKIVAEMSEWLLSEARKLDGMDAFSEAIVDRLRAVGIPVTRFTTGVPSLHPQVNSFSTLWEQGKGVTLRKFRREPTEMKQVRNSPIFKAYDEGRSQRYRLEDPPVPGEYEMLTEFRLAGLTDYLVLALPFSDGSFKAMSFATNQAGGFADYQVAVMNGLAQPLAVTLEIFHLRHLAETLVETYIGPVAGKRVLNGAIKRGSGETIEAVIWFCDLKGFTEISENLPGDVLIGTLNDYFDAVTTAIESQGGEILKFIGDAVLAIFQTSGDSNIAAAKSALTSAELAIARIVEMNMVRRSTGLPEIDCGIALHYGQVIYGNVGGQNRLDFTVIGPAVNLASRIESLTRNLKRPVLVSAAFAAIGVGDFETMGQFELKGISRQQTVFAPLSR